MRCSKCGAENPDGAKFCIECASRFARRCSSCGKENPPRAKFCLECSKPIDPPPVDTRETLKSLVRVSTVANGAQLEGERKTVTALFADIKGSTELEQDLDPEEARAIIDPALKLMIVRDHLPSRAHPDDAEREHEAQEHQACGRDLPVTFFENEIAITLVPFASRSKIELVFHLALRSVGLVSVIAGASATREPFP